MKNTNIWNHSLQEGILFMLLGGALGYYSIESYGKSFNKDWSQSPYLFPILVAVLFCALAVSLLVQGIRQRDLEIAKTTNKNEGKQWLRVLTIMAISLGYYFAMMLLKIPYITFGVLSWSFTIANFEVVSLIFLVVMMFYLGVRKPIVLILVPAGTILFLSIIFRAMLHVLLP